MALAAICSDMHSLDPKFRNAFRGFIVDHGVREGSDREAAKVAAELRKMGISARILRLAWGEQNPKFAPNFETLARKLRYRALGTACRKARISHLLVAHHADDQAETVLSRIVTGYMGSGLKGIKRGSRIPECEGIYGVDASGADRHRHESRRSLIENGGVHLRRPLLPYKKTDLIALCRAKGVHWVEDETNEDKTLTQRNTIRHLMKNDLLPTALNPHNLAQMAIIAGKEVYRTEHEAKRLFDGLKIELHIRTGKAVVKLPKETLRIPGRSREDVYHIKAELLRKLLLLVSPCNEIVLQDLDRAMDMIFPDAAPRPISCQPMPVQIAGVNILPGPAIDDEHKLTLTRTIPTKSEMQISAQITQPKASSGYTPWLLWDSRYWLRLHVDQVHKDVLHEVRFLTPGLVGEIRKKVGHLPDYDNINQSERWTVPVILAYKSGELIGADLPTASMGDVSQRPALQSKSLIHGAVECHYKYVAFDDSSRGHSIFRAWETDDNVIDGTQNPSTEQIRQVLDKKRSSSRGTNTLEIDDILNIRNQRVFTTS